MRALFVTLTALAVVAGGHCLALAAEQQTAADLLPSSTVLYAELGQPGRLLDTLLTHPLVGRLQQMEQVQQQLQSGQFRQLKAVVKYVEQQMGMDWQTALRAATGGGIYLGVDAATEGVAILVKSTDQQRLARVRETFIQLVRDEDARKGRADRIETMDYRGLTPARLGRAIFVQLGPWLLITNKPDLGQYVADSYLDGSDRSLAGNDNFQAARRSVRGQPTAWAYVDVATLRAAGVARELFAEKHDNPAAELLVGGLVSVLGKTPYMTGQLWVDQQRLRLVASMAYDPSWTPERRQFFFAADGHGRAPVPFEPPGTLLSLGTYRDIGAFWLAKDDLFVEKVAARLAQADSQLSTLFAGLSFGEEVLGAAAPQIQLILARQTFDGSELPQPAIKLPAGALVFQMKHPEQMRRRFKVAFQSLIGFLNVTMAQKGQPQLDLNTERRGDVQIVSAAYVPEPDRPEPRVHYNFSPTLAFAGSYCIVSSARQLAEQLVERAGAPNVPQEQERTVNTRASLNIEVLRQLLQDNRQNLVAQNMLKKGQSRQQADEEIGRLLSVLRAARQLSLELATVGDTVQIELALDLKTAQE